jgi:alpha-N-acetylglucosaminidase
MPAIFYEITASYQKDIIKLGIVNEFLSLSHKLEKLMGTREEFLFGKWIKESRKHAFNPEEAELYEWNARAIITKWGGRVLYGYAIKDWSGLYSSYYLPKWEKLFAEMRIEITGSDKLDYEKFTKEIIVWEDNWISNHEDNLISVPTGNSVILAKELWEEYGDKLRYQK